MTDPGPLGALLIFLGTTTSSLLLTVIWATANRRAGRVQATAVTRHRHSHPALPQRLGRPLPALTPAPIVARTGTHH